MVDRLQNKWIDGLSNDDEQVDKEKMDMFLDFYGMRGVNYTQEGYVFDVIIRNATGGTIAGEIKTRDIKTLKFKDCYIEMSKMNKLRELWYYYRVQPLYFNFIGDNVYVWKLNELTRANNYFHILIKPKNAEPYYGDRFGLYWEDAYKFIYNGSGYTIEKPTGPMIKYYQDPTYSYEGILGLIISNQSKNKGEWLNYLKLDQELQ